MRILLPLCLFFALAASAAAQDGTNAIRESLQSAKKLIVVTTPNWNAAEGTLTRYERRGQKWIRVSDSIPVVVGHAGLAWDPKLAREATDRYPGPVKHEGDGRSPAGIFLLDHGTFGFADQLPGSRDYLHLTSTVECVDDPDSRYYAEIVDRSTVDQVDWKSSEKMSSIPQYRWGVIVNYNMDHPTRGDGSCIFLHQWSSPTSGTAGCTAMAPQNIEQVVRWVNEEGSSVLVQLPKSEYERLRVSWKLL